MQVKKFNYYKRQRKSHKKNAKLHRSGDQSHEFVSEHEMGRTVRQQIYKKNMKLWRAIIAHFLKGYNNLRS